MNIFNFVKKIKAKFSGDTVLSTIDTIEAELTNLVLPLYKNNLSWLVSSDKSLKSNLYTTHRDALVEGMVKDSVLTGNNPFALISKSLNNSLDILQLAKTSLAGIEDADNISDASITLEKATILRLVDMVAFASKYSRLWIDAVISAESYHLDGVEEVQLTPSVVKYLGENRADFARVIGILATPKAKIEEKLKKIPDMVLSEANPSLATAVSGREATDPLSMNLVQSKWDLIYVIGMVYSDYQVSRYKAAKEEVAYLELRIQRLRRQMDGKADPHIESVIEKRQGQVDALRGKIEKMENSIK